MAGRAWSRHGPPGGRATEDHAMPCAPGFWNWGGARSAGGIAIFQDRMGSESPWLTASTETVYASSLLGLKTVPWLSSHRLTSRASAMTCGYGTWATSAMPDRPQPPQRACHDPSGRESPPRRRQTHGGRRHEARLVRRPGSPVAAKRHNSQKSNILHELYTI